MVGRIVATGFLEIKKKEKLVHIDTRENKIEASFMLSCYIYFFTLLNGYTPGSDLILLW